MTRAQRIEAAWKRSRAWLAVARRRWRVLTDPAGMIVPSWAPQYTAHVRATRVFEWRRTQLIEEVERCTCGAPINLAETVLFSGRQHRIVGCPACCDWRIREPAATLTRIDK